MRSSVSDIFAAERRRQRSMPRTMSSMAVLATVLAMPVKESLAANSYGFLGVPDGCLTATCSGTGYTIDRTFATSVDTVTVNAPSALITWVPNDTNGGTASVADAINFLPSGNTVNYVAGSGLANGEYTILNRIVPQPNADGRSIALNGTITTDTAKGNVWFYSPNGIVVGSTASFDVGGLLLTTSNITAGNVTLDGDGYVTAVDTQTSIAGAAVTIQSGADISTGNYFGILAPKIDQGGIVKSKGGIAYISAEQAKLSIDDTSGLFNIEVGVGADMLGGIAHSGTSRGVISTPDGLAHPIYFVAVPKNDAISMLLGGNIGFQVAGGAEATERGIVLSAGRDIAFGSLNAGGARSAGAGTGSVSVSGLPSLTAGTLIQAGVPLDIAGNVQIETNGAPVTIDAGSDISFTGTVSIDTSASFNLTGPTQAGNISLLAGGGGIDFGSDVTLLANGDGFETFSGTGGTIAITASGTLGEISFHGGLTASADGRGGMPASSGDGGDGFGGTITLTANGEAGIIADNGMSLTAIGRGGQTYEGNGGDGLGGVILLTANAGSGITVDGGPVTLDASSIGGDVFQTGTAGKALSVLPGGANPPQSYVALQTNGGSITFGDAQTPVDVTLIANGRGGDGGTANAGAVDVLASGGSGGITFNGALNAEAYAQIGSDGSSQGGNATGGLFRMRSSGSAAIQLASLGAQVYARGGDQSSSGAGGNAVGGKAIIEAQGGSITGTDSIYVDATGTGGRGISAGGNGTGGAAEIFANGGAITLGGAQTSITLDAGGTGGNSEVDGLGSGVGGTGTGGVAGFEAFGATLTLNGQAIANAGGTGGDGRTGGNGLGGRPPGLDTQDYDPFYGVYARASNGAINAPGGLILAADGIGGGSHSDGSNVGQAGNGTGGYAELLATNLGGSTASATISAPSVQMSAVGQGGNGGDPGADGVGSAGGLGQGGVVIMGAYAGRGHLSLTSALLSATGIGGDGADGASPSEGDGGTGGAGGTGIGGNIQAGVFSGGQTAENNGSADIQSLNMNAAGIGGYGGAGGSSSTGTGGGGGAGGQGIGGGGTDAGSLAILSRGAPVTIGSATLIAHAQGGAGGSGGSGMTASGAVGADGAGKGGNFAILSTYRYQTTVGGQLLSIGTLVADVSGFGNPEAPSGPTTAGNFLIATNGGNLTISNGTVHADGQLAPTNSYQNVFLNTTTVSEVSAGNGTVTLGTSPASFTISTEAAQGTHPVNFYRDAGGQFDADLANCTLNGGACQPVARPVSPPPVVSPPPPPPPPPVSPPPPPPVSPPPPPPPPPPVSPPPPPPPPPVSPPPPVIEEPAVNETVTTETTNISSSIQSSLTGTRVAGGSIKSTEETGATAPGSDSTGASGDSTGSAGDGDDEGGDGSDDAGSSTSGGGSVGGPNLLIDTSNIGSDATQIDTPVLSSGNSSLWPGADGLTDTGGSGGDGPSPAGAGGASPGAMPVGAPGMTPSGGDATPSFGSIGNQIFDDGGNAASGNAGGAGQSSGGGQTPAPGSAPPSRDDDRSSNGGKQ
ncbi:beta strand repeat-containing protein [Rhizorhabdus histidinilytica]|uniref:Filamentous hemagglutinin family N-terminal domain-containing protein n=1 Tax=Rhizorhabdus histidinilytica TaxID=439228 RepID=A0A1T5DAK4_9SPHN|nr:filamentous hemagglutinin N-terminal domain-containing protein [Rhizorhabdus histidinilytica]SKB68802.1 filamentous hemagglutinin family N-terminal domain-containing protein [Rhizorhabdus histidinilytica]